MDILQDLLAKALYYEQERQKSFANPPKNCRHEMVYSKDGENMHCQYCDKFMYREDDD